MRQKSLAIGLLVTLVAATGGIIGAQAASTSENDAIADLAAVKISLIEAVTAAESKSGGHATRAELESDAGKLAYEVEIVMPNQKVLDMSINATSGAVMSQRADAADHGEDERD